MKRIAVLLFLFSTVSADCSEALQKYKQRMFNIATSCRADVGATDDDVAPMFDHKFPTTDNGKCFIGCMHKKMGVQNEEGKIDKEGSYAELALMKAAVNSEYYDLFEKAAIQCLEKPLDGDNYCESGINLYRCLRNEGEILGMRPGDKYKHC